MAKIFLWTTGLVTAVYIAAGVSLAAVDMPRLERAVVFSPDFSPSIVSNPRLSAFQGDVKSSFPEAVKSSGRFRVIDAELARSARTDEKVRNELIEQFEVDGFVSLEVLDRTDTIDFVARLMGRKLEILLQEAESIDAAGIDSAGAGGVKRVIEGLVFRLFNRVPYDAKVLSMQGRFIVVSGGAEQGVEVGDDIAISRVSVTSRHPATGAWNKFSVEELGRGKVAEVKGRTSIARLTDQIKPGAIRVGDGVKLVRIASRARFARETTTAEYGAGVLGSGTRPIPVIPMAVPEKLPASPSENPSENPSAVTPQSAPAAPTISSAVAVVEPVPAVSPVPASEEEGGIGGGRQGAARDAAPCGAGDGSAAGLAHVAVAVFGAHARGFCGV